MESATDVVSPSRRRSPFVAAEPRDTGSRSSPRSLRALRVELRRSAARIGVTIEQALPRTGACGSASGSRRGISPRTTSTTPWTWTQPDDFPDERRYRAGTYPRTRPGSIGATGCPAEGIAPGRRRASNWAPGTTSAPTKPPSKAGTCRTDVLDVLDLDMGARTALELEYELTPSTRTRPPRCSCWTSRTSAPTSTGTRTPRTGRANGPGRRPFTREHAARQPSESRRRSRT